MTNSGWQAALGVVCVGVLASAVPAAAQSGQPSGVGAGGRGGRGAEGGRASFHAPEIKDTASLPGPRQPIFFRHDVHAGQDKIPCLYCHSTVTVSSEPGIPALQTCIGCHQIIGGSTPSHTAEIQKVRKAWSDRQPPQWIRIHALPGFVRFPHQRHIKVLGTGACVMCHGQVETMAQVSQVSTLRMGWCVRCHAERKVTQDCTACHY
ncbi:MAG TPA: cytochrome c3 family protein [Gemmatimonadales bacterium]|nr:cytochrome c3 family protein [Gemmatimonadales bacterium]